MSQTPDMRPQFWLNGARRDDFGTFVPVDCTDTRTIINNYIRLKEVPDVNTTGVGGVAIAGMHEVATRPAAPNTFFVNYGTGRVYFHGDDEGKEVTAIYRGLGSLVAVDEINYLYDNVKARSTFTGLSDTADTLIPQAYLRVDKYGKVVGCSTATVGRAVSSAVEATFSPSSPYRVQGTPFDIISVYKAAPWREGVLAMTADVTGQGEVSGGVWSAPAGTSTVSFGGILTGTVNRLDSVSLAAEYVHSSIRFVLQFSDGYYCMRAPGDIRFISSAFPNIASVGNDITELANLSDGYLREKLGEPFAIVFEVVNDPQDAFVHISTTVSLHGRFDGGWQQAPVTAEYVNATREWVITPIESGTFLVVTGSGHDELACRCDALDFANVPANNSVQVNVEAQTFVQVLYRDADPQAALHKTYPQFLDTNAPPEYLVNTPDVMYGPKSSDYDKYVWVNGGTDVRKPITFLDFNRDKTLVNRVHSGFAATGNPLDVCAGRSWTSALLGKVAGYPNATLKVCDTLKMLSNGTQPAYVPAVGGWFKYVGGTPFIMTNSGIFGNRGTNYTALGTGYAYVQYLNATTIRFSVSGPRGDGYSRVLIQDIPVNEGWNYILVTRLYNGNLHEIFVNGVHHSWNLALIYGAGNVESYWYIDTIGSANVDNPGLFLTENPSVWDSDLVDPYQYRYVYDTDTAALASMFTEIPAYTSYRGQQSFEVDGVLSLYTQAGSAVGTSLDATRYYFTKDGVKYVLNYVGDFERVPDISDPVLYSRGVSISTLVSLYNYDKTKFLPFTVNALIPKSSEHTSAYLRLLEAYSDADRPYVLARAGVDMKVVYNDAAQSWIVTNTLGRSVDILVALSGVGTSTDIVPIRFSELVDTPNLMTPTPQVLVALDGTVQKRKYVHPYLLR